MKDPFVEEVRKVRQKHAKRFNNDLNSIFDDIMEHQKQYSNRLVRLKAQKLGSITHKDNLVVYNMVSEKPAEYNVKKEKKNMD